MKEHKPFIAADQNVPEINWITLVTGVILGIIFGASSLYLALKVGMTVSASIPVAVMSITIFRAFSKIFGIRKTTILENNTVMTAGSAGESLAFGVAVTMPALLILGFDMSLEKTMLVSVLGGLLGILMMIPLRRVLIVKEHGNLTYPEGTACAEVLIVGEKGGTSAMTVFTGFFVGLAYKFMNVANKLWDEAPAYAFEKFKGARIGIEVSPELLGVGYIIGPRIASVMMGGAVLASFVLVPMIVLFGAGLAAPLFPAAKLISQMSASEIRNNYVLYIGAGAVAAGGLISLIQSLPTIYAGAIGGLGGLSKVKDGGSTARTDRDLPMKFVLLGILALVVVITVAPALHMNVVGAVLIVACGFLFVTVSSRLTGTIGSSSNPISGMTVATLLITCVIFLAMGWVGPEDRIAALMVAAIVCIAASNGGTTSQDLKSGFLVGSTPKYQQIAILAGSFTSALVIGYILQVLNESSTIYSKKNLPPVVVQNVAELTETAHLTGPEAKADANEYKVLRVRELSDSGPLAGLAAGKYLVNNDGTLAYVVDPGINGSLKHRDNDETVVQKYDAPKARLMSLIIDGILTQKLPWGLVLLGVFIAVVLELCGISSLPFAVGVYLPIAISSPIFVGGVVRWLVEKWTASKKEDLSSDTSNGVLLSSGLIAGGAIAGVGIAFMSMGENIMKTLDFSGSFPLAHSPVFASLIFLALAVFLGLVAAGKLLKSK